MEVKGMIKKCDICQKDASSLCFQCMFYFCEPCFKLAHNNEKNKNHKKEKIDYYIPFDLRCSEHPLVPMNLFCVDDKGNLYNYIIFIYIELCCTECYFDQKHENHKILKISNEENLKKENIKIDDPSKDFDNNIQKLNNLRNKIEKEMIEIDKRYEKVDNEVTKSYEIKIEKLKKEEEDLKEKLKTEVTKIKEKFEIYLSEINNLQKTSEKIIKGINSLQNEEKNMIKTLSYVSKINNIIFIFMIIS